MCGKSSSSVPSVSSSEQEEIYKATKESGASNESENPWICMKPRDLTQFNPTYAKICAFLYRFSPRTLCSSSYIQKLFFFLFVASRSAPCWACSAYLAGGMQPNLITNDDWTLSLVWYNRRGKWKKKTLHTTRRLIHTDMQTHTCADVSHSHTHTHS